MDHSVRMPQPSDILWSEEQKPRDITYESTRYYNLPTQTMAWRSRESMYVGTWVWKSDQTLWRCLVLQFGRPGPFHVHNAYQLFRAQTHLDDSWIVEAIAVAVDSSQVQHAEHLPKLEEALTHDIYESILQQPPHNLYAIVDFFVEGGLQWDPKPVEMMMRQRDAFLEPLIPHFQAWIERNKQFSLVQLTLAALELGRRGIVELPALVGGSIALLSQRKRDAGPDVWDLGGVLVMKIEGHIDLSCIVAFLASQFHFVATGEHVQQLTSIADAFDPVIVSTDL